MKNTELLEILRPLMRGGDRVYLLRRRKKRTWLRRIRELVLDTSFLAGSLPDLPDALAVWYLVASDAEGTIVRVADKAIQETISVPGWRSEWKDKFRSVIIDDREYAKIGKIQ